MKKVFLTSYVLFLVLTFTPAFAQMGQGMMMGEGQQMPMMQMMPVMMKCQQMMMGHGMQMQEMMHMMMDMMKIQKKMMRGLSPAERKEMIKEMDRMQDRMEKMMSMRIEMMMGMDSSQAKLKCAEEWLKKAMTLHELHMKDPKTTTDASQMELMNQIKKAYECISGAAMPPEEPEKKEPKKEETPKTDPHKHQ